MVPLNYIHCLNSACTRGESCLRHLVALHVPQNLKSVVAVNPSNYPADAGNCPYFRSTVKRRYAWGISTLFDNIPYKKALMLKGWFAISIPKPLITVSCMRNAGSRRQNRSGLPDFSCGRVSRKLPCSTVILKSMIGMNVMYRKREPRSNFLSDRRVGVPHDLTVVGHSFSPGGRVFQS